jgi:hypothetical protein
MTSRQADAGAPDTSDQGAYKPRGLQQNFEVVSRILRMDWTETLAILTILQYCVRVALSVVASIMHLATAGA